MQAFQQRHDKFNDWVNFPLTNPVAVGDIGYIEKGKWTVVERADLIKGDIRESTHQNLVGRFITMGVESCTQAKLEVEATIPNIPVKFSFKPLDFVVTSESGFVLKTSESTTQVNLDTPVCEQRLVTRLNQLTKARGQKLSVVTSTITAEEAILVVCDGKGTTFSITTGVEGQVPVSAHMSLEISSHSSGIDRQGGKNVVVLYTVASVEKKSILKIRSIGNEGKPKMKEDEEELVTITPHYELHEMNIQ